MSNDILSVDHLSVYQRFKMLQSKINNIRRTASIRVSAMLSCSYQGGVALPSAFFASLHEGPMNCLRLQTL